MRGLSLMRNDGRHSAAGQRVSSVSDDVARRVCRLPRVFRLNRRPVDLGYDQVRCRRGASRGQTRRSVGGYFSYACHACGE